MIGQPSLPRIDPAQRVHPAKRARIADRIYRALASRVGWLAFATGGAGGLASATDGAGGLAFATNGVGGSAFATGGASRLASAAGGAGRLALAMGGAVIRRASLALRLCLVLAALVLGTLPAFAQEDHGFMPKGGNVLLQQVLAQASATDLHAILGTSHSAAEWQDTMRPRTGALSEREQRTLATYLAGNLPLPADVVEQAATGAKLAAALPPDGYELAWNHCGSCHSLFTGYLMQDRDTKGWLSVFLSPFHRQIKLTDKERTTFAGYSSINMPMQAQDVPPDLRF